MIRLGVLGYGRRIHGMIANNFRQVDTELRVVAVVDPDEKGARARMENCDQDAIFYKDIPSMIR